MNSRGIKKILVGLVLIGLVLPILILAKPSRGASAVPGTDYQTLVQSFIDEIAVGLEDLGVDNPGLLQTNPFYFIKSFRRSTQRTFSLGVSNKAETELSILNEILAEMKKLQMLLPDQQEAIRNSLNDYLAGVNNLESNLASLKVSSAQAYNFLAELTRISWTHIRVLDSLRVSDNLSLNERIDLAQNRLSEVVVRAGLRWESSEEFANRVQLLVNSQKQGLFRDLASAMVLDRWLDAAGESDQKPALIEAQAGLLFHFLGVMDSVDLDLVLGDVLVQMPGSVIRKVKVLDQLREYVLNADRKNQLALIRQNLLDNSLKQRTVGKLDAEKIIANTALLIETLNGQFLVSQRSSKDFKSLISRAEFNLDQAEKFFEMGQYHSAFGLATSALAAVYSATGYVGQPERSLIWLQSQYDQLSSQGNNEFLNQAEKLLAKAADALNQKKLDFDLVVSNLRAIVQLLARAEYSF